jgi:hypothetical protein
MTPEQLAEWILSGTWVGHSAYERDQLRDVAAELRRLAAENEALRKDAERYKKALKEFIRAWENLPEGFYTGPIICKWLNGPMVKAIKKARAAIAAMQKDTP